MATVATRADSIRTYLTGAGSDGASQSDPNASLGNYRSSTEVVYLNATAPSNVTGVTIDYAGGYNESGTASLKFTHTGSYLQWKAPGSSNYGTLVDVSANGSYLIEDGDDNSKFARVTVVSASLPGSDQTDSIDLTYATNKVFDNVSSSEASAGDTEYRGLMLKNVNSASIDSVTIFCSKRGISNTATSGGYSSSGAVTVNVTSTAGYPDAGFIFNSTSNEKMYYTAKTATSFTVPSGGRAQFGTSAGAGNTSDTIEYCPPFQIALEAPSSSHIQTIANESTAPTGPTFSQPTTVGAGLSIGTMAASALYGIWIKRPVVAGSTPLNSVIKEIEFSFGAA